MTNNSGTLIIAPIRPTAVGDTYPTAYANEILGGHKSFTTITERDSLPVSLMQVGMTCYVSDTASLYALTNLSPVTWTILVAADSPPITFDQGEY